MKQIKEKSTPLEVVVETELLELHVPVGEEMRVMAESRAAHGSRYLKWSKVEVPKKCSGHLLKGPDLQWALDAWWEAMGLFKLEGECLSARYAKEFGGHNEGMTLLASGLRCADLRVWACILKVGFGEAVCFRGKNLH